jgi:DNA invertase Pin-like site-specific DNA recombinase
MKHAIGYLRISSDEQADSGLGLEAQRQRITADCQLKALHFDQVDEDLAISGGKPLATRPASSQLLARAKKSKALVIVAKLDWLFRSVADATTVIADFDKNWIELVAIAESFDMASPYGRVMAQMASVFAELERAMIREWTRSALHVKRLRGERISGHAPFRWDFGAGGRLVKNPREQRTIARVRRLRSQGLSYRGIARRLDREGIRPERGQRWAHTTVKSVLLRNTKTEPGAWQRGG